VSSPEGTRGFALLSVALALTASVLAPSPALAKTHKVKALRVAVPTPAEGDVTVEEITTKIPSRVAKFPELQLFASDGQALPANVIALTATRTQRTKRSTTFRTDVIVLDRRSAATTARAAGEDVLGSYTAKLILGEELEPVKFKPIGYAGLAFDFTATVPATTDLWTQASAQKLGTFIEVGVQPNANAANTDIRTCWALSDVIKLEPNGKPTPGLTYDFFDGPTTQPWKQNGIGSMFAHFAADCHAGASGLNTAFTAVDNDLGLGPQALGPYTPMLPPKPSPIGPQQADMIIFGAELAGDSELAEEAEDDYVLWVLEEIYGGLSDSLMAHAASTSSTAVPDNGQVTKVEVQGAFAGDCPVKNEESVCEKNVFIQDLRPLPEGELEVVETSQPFTIGRTETTYVVEPINFQVHKGDYIGLATVGGKFKVLKSAPGVQADTFVGDKQDMNGDKISATKKRSDQELNMRVTLKTSE
jgi:hypothetical protein